MYIRYRQGYSKFPGVQRDHEKFKDVTTTMERQMQKEMGPGIMLWGIGAKVSENEGSFFDS